MGIKQPGSSNMWSADRLVEGATKSGQFLDCRPIRQRALSVQKRIYELLVRYRIPHCDYNYFASTLWPVSP